MAVWMDDAAGPRWRRWKWWNSGVAGYVGNGERAPAAAGIGSRVDRQLSSGSLLPVGRSQGVDAKQLQGNKGILK